MEVSFINALEKDKIYIIGFDPITWKDDDIEGFMKLARDSGLNAIGVLGEGVKIYEPIGIDKEAVMKLLNGPSGSV